MDGLEVGGAMLMVMLILGIMADIMCKEDEP